MKYDHPKEGEWIQPVEKGYKLRCCDCGLVHKIDFEIFKGNIQFRMWRDDRATAQIRRHKRRLV